MDAHTESFLKLVPLVKVPIAYRLFIAVLLTAVVVSASGLALLRLGIEHGFARYVAEIELNRLDLLAKQLETDYQQRGGWPQLQAGERANWLGEEFRKLRKNPFAALVSDEILPPGELPKPIQECLSNVRLPLPPPDRLALEQRVGLLDVAGKLVSGAPPAAAAPVRTLRVNGTVVGYLSLLPAADPSDALTRTFMADQAQDFMLIALLCLLLSALAAWLLARHFRRPIAYLVEAARALTQGRFATRVPIRRSDELGTLAQNFDQLAQMLERHEDLRRQWVADTSHELRTPLAVLRAQIEALQDGVREPDAEQFNAMHRQVQTLARLVDELYELARADVGQLDFHFSAIDPWPLVSEQAAAFRDRFAAAGLQLQLVPPAQALTARIDAERLRQVIANLLENSLRYTDSGGRVRLSDASDAEVWRLLVDDSAPGVGAAERARLAERFFRVETSRSRASGGSGLGLALCQRIAEGHAGRLAFAASALGGLQVVLEIPRHRT